MLLAAAGAEDPQLGQLFAVSTRMRVVTVGGVFCKGLFVNVVQEPGLAAVVVAVSEASAGDTQLERPVRLAVIVMRKQPVAKDEVARSLNRTRREYMNVRVGFAERHTPVLLPSGLSCDQAKPCRLQNGQVGNFVGRVGDNKINVDDRFRRQTGDRSGANVVDRQRLTVQRMTKHRLDLFELSGPRWIIGDDSGNGNLPRTDTGLTTKPGGLGIEWSPQRVSRHIPQGIRPCLLGAG